MQFYTKIILISTVISLGFICDIDGGLNMFDIRYWRCFLKRSTECPDNDIKFFLYTPEGGMKGKRIDVRNHLALKYSGYDEHKNNVIIIHGFNSTESRSPTTVLRNAYLERGTFNVFTVDWKTITEFPCYLTSLSNTKLVAKCAAQFYAYIMENGGKADKTTCVGHSLGAHICGMISNHLHIKQHKIVGLDPARPLITQYASKVYRLGVEDAYHVQIIHSNAGVLGEINQVGHVDFCVNGGAAQPGCKGHALKQIRCSHFQSACFFAATIRNPSLMVGMPCSKECPKKTKSWGLLPGKSVLMGFATPFTARGTYCVKTTGESDCPFNT